MRSLVLSLFSTNKNKKVDRTKIYLTRVVYMAARQALDKSRKFVKTTIYRYRVVLQGKDIQAKKTSTKTKNLHSKEV